MGIRLQCGLPQALSFLSWGHSDENGRMVLKSTWNNRQQGDDWVYMGKLGLFMLWHFIFSSCLALYSFIPHPFGWALGVFFKKFKSYALCIPFQSNAQKIDWSWKQKEPSFHCYLGFWVYLAIKVIVGKVQQRLNPKQQIELRSINNLVDHKYYLIVTHTLILFSWKFWQCKDNPCQ